MKGISILDSIKNRRSIHTFKKEEVQNSVLLEIFHYASYAPTHYMKEPWQIKVFQEKGKEYFIEEIISSYERIGMLRTDKEPKTIKMKESLKQFLLEIPHHVVIFFEVDEDPIRYEEDYAAVCAFIQNVQLAAWEHGVGVLWTITPYMHDQTFVERVGINSDVMKIAAVLQMGYPLKVPRNKGRTAIEEKLEIINK
ncbi:nitroreductase [Oceanobacillus picturae]|uniref:Nitroreductase n=2 Tax=Oceanobacillus picturae TaxID=171693 RepID=A0A0U9H9S9_9BACI|nr:nitroreductase [Oceanobacillus picturae]GAQ18553.1 nitroreductase [Oceanobacillus picturae]